MRALDEIALLVTPQTRAMTFIIFSLSTAELYPAHLWNYCAYREYNAFLETTLPAG